MNEECLTEEDSGMLNDIKNDNDKKREDENISVEQTRHAFRIFNRGRGAPKKGEREKELKDLTDMIKLMQKQIGKKRKVSSRGWCYLLEGFGYITKDQFDKCQEIITECRKKGYLPIDFVLEDSTRQFYFVEDLEIETEDPYEYIKRNIEDFKEEILNKNDISFWEGNKFYVQELTEKIDLLHLFAPICQYFHIPLANAKGWSDLISRYKLALKFKKAEELGYIPVLLYYTDHDPAGIFIAKTMKENLEEISLTTGWHPDNLIIDRIGITEEFMRGHNIDWIDNLITAKGRNIGKLYKRYLEIGQKKWDKKTQIYDYEIDYVKKYGVKKCEATAILPYSNEAKEDLIKHIVKYIPLKHVEEYEEKVERLQNELFEAQDNIEFDEALDNLIENIEENKNDN